MHPTPPTCSVLFALLLPAACASPGAHGPDAPSSAELARPLPPLEQAVTVWDAQAGRALAFDELLARLGALDAVFLGETHLDDVTHRVELAVLEGLIERRGGRVVLALEMFERDVQPVLDDYLAGRIDEAAFLAAARPWKNYATDYRPLVEAAKRHGVPVIAANTPAALRRKVASGGKAALDALAPEERRLLPEEILPAEAGYWERVDRATRGHMNFASLPEEKRLYSGQNLWDNSMGAACAEALAAHPGATIVHVVGGFHVMYGSGTAAQFRRRAPGSRSAVVEILPVSALASARPERDAERGDYLVYASALARSLSNGTHAVAVPLELRYTLDLPDSASDARPAPLLVWLPDADERPADARAYLRAALGSEAAVAVVEPPFPERTDDLAPGGRWARASELRSDQGRLLHGLERLVEYVTRRLPVDGTRVVVAGRGHGATAVLWSALYGEWLDARFLAFEPRG
ncbi:MAG TPA: ChaN family lipoprotein, partial [Planctomycetota bacterium]